MNRFWLQLGLIVFCAAVWPETMLAGGFGLDPDSEERLTLPKLPKGLPAAGKRVKATAPEYAGSEVFHTIYLPGNWKKGGERLPIIFEYTGNYFPKSGSTGEVEDAGLGYGLSGGRYIWVSLPYISEDGGDNEVTWWGDEGATVQYAKTNVPRIIEEFNANPNAVFLCGFSRGAIGVNYLGLHDDEIAGLWSAFITHDHFDGIKEWGKTDWGSPLETYRSEAVKRLKRIGNRPYLVCQNGDAYGTLAYLQSVLPSIENFTFIFPNTTEVFGHFPNDIAKNPHTDLWPLLPSPYRSQVWQWMNRALVE